MQILDYQNNNKFRANDLGKTTINDDHLMSELLNNKNDGFEKEIKKQSNGAVGETIHEEDE